MATEFRTEVDILPFPFSINYKTPTLFCGSCFTENIGSIMVDRKLPALVNPFGVLYNPISIKLVLDRILNGTAFKESELTFRNGLWFSYLHHTSYSSQLKEKCLDNINSELSRATEFAKSMKYLLITFGTARVYYLYENNLPVANCHKLPSREFDNRLLDVDTIVNTWSELIDTLFSRTPELKIIFTISPVRHWKDGAVGNQQSKSILNIAVHELSKKYPNNAFYFPAYEIMMDDLRDYRFYANDMLHPSGAAVEYIWGKFKNSTISSESLAIMRSIEKINLAINHRPYNPDTPEHKAFVANILEQIKQIKKENPELNFLKEEQMLQSSL